MLNKIFLGVFAVAVIVMGILTFITYNQLQSIGFKPEVVTGNYKYWEAFYWQGLILFSLILLIVSNIILWTRKTAWALWLTFLFSAIFIMVNTWWLSEILLNYEKESGLEQTVSSVSGIGGAILCVALAGGVFANHFAALKLYDKMYAKDEPKELSEPSVTDRVETDREKIASETDKA